MTTRRARRPTRRAAKTLLCMVLALATLVSPWESGLLPGPLEDLAGPTSVSAQPPPPPTVIDGTPNACLATPVLWSPQPGDADFSTAAECILELPACPESPLVNGQYMRLSVPPAGLATEFPELDRLYADAIEYPPIPGMDRYPEFCEERVLNSVDPVVYAACTSLTGYTVLSYDGGDGCRILYPITCAAGLHRDGSATCRAVQRRTWTCRTGYIPRNEFNTCYQAPTYSGTTHPACRQGAPEFLVMACEEYVGNDFIHNATTINCAAVANYPTGTPARHLDGTQAVAGAPTVTFGPNNKSGPSSDYWCAFDTRYLITACHRTDITPSECSTESTALCLKRASATGGCNVAADTIRCRALGAAFAQQPTVTTIEEVRAQGCAPCLILPFRGIPAHCQLTSPGPTGSPDPKLQRILSVMDDFAIDLGACLGVNTPADLASNAACRAATVCADPPRGRIDWTSNHHSQLAVVNSPILVQFLDIPIEDHEAALMYYSYRHSDPIHRDYDRAPRFTDASGLASRFRTFSEVDQSTQHRNVAAMITAECRVRADPYFEVVIEELWPDNDRGTIIQLFGADALASWDSLLSAEQERRTLSRGLELLGATPTADQLRERSDQLTTRIHCNLAGGRACRWMPARPGYYRLRGVGAWLVSRSGRREWGPNDYADYLRALNDHLASLTTGSCPARPNWYNEPRNDARMRIEDCILEDLRHTGILQPSEVGLSDDLSTVLPLPPHPHDDALLFNEDHAAAAGCRTWDFRVSCTGGSGGYGTGNYTETEPIGILVHEIRVSTVMPG